MIYEKRGLDAPKVRRADTRAGDCVPTFCFSLSTAEESVPAVNEGNENKKNSAKRKNSCRKTGLIAAAIFVASFFVIDARFFECGFSERFSAAVKDGAQRILYAIAEEDVVASEGLRERTLYTLPYSEEVVEKEDTESPMQQKEDMHLTVAADSTFSESYADGERLFPITALDLSAPTFLSLNNETSFSPDMSKISQSYPESLSGTNVSEGPQVLILHTHGTESYTQNTDMYPEGEEMRSTDIRKNVVRTGEEIARTLSDFGIESIHCSTMHDESSFINAYSYSAKTVKKYLEEYPSLRFVIDVHRDAIIKDDGESIKAVTDIAGESYAQIMFVVGTNGLGHNHPGWQDNLSLAVRLQKEIEQTYPTLCRSINLRNVPFNQQLSCGYLLLEIGTCGNTLEEALRSARAFGENLARVILKG